MNGATRKLRRRKAWRSHESLSPPSDPSRPSEDHQGSDRERFLGNLRAIAAQHRHGAACFSSPAVAVHRTRPAKAGAYGFHCTQASEVSKPSGKTVLKYPHMDEPLRELRDIIREKSLRVGDFTLSSG